MEFDGLTCSSEPERSCGSGLPVVGPTQELHEVKGAPLQSPAQAQPSHHLDDLLALVGADPTPCRRQALPIPTDRELPHDRDGDEAGDAADHGGTAI